MFIYPKCSIKVTPCDSHARIIPPEPEDLPSNLLDGPDQRARDDAMRAAMAAELEGKPITDGNPNQLADHTKNHIRFDYDAYAEDVLLGGINCPSLTCVCMLLRF
jgi:hypothetical protein